MIMSSSNQPNILFLFSDQHSARALGCYGNSQVHTPHLDRLATEGVRLERAYCNNPICTPSRMCFLSGQYCHNHGYYGLMGPMPARLPSLFTHAKAHGYRIGMAGKIHTPTGWLARHCDVVDDGYGFEIPLTKSSVDRLEGQQGMAGNDYSLYLERLGLADLRDDKHLGDYTRNSPVLAQQGLDARPSQLPANRTIEAWSAEMTIKFIEETHRDRQPFCFWMTVPRPHQTYAPAKPFWDLYNESDLTLPPNARNNFLDRDVAARETKRLQENGDWIAYQPRDLESARRRVLRGYYGCVSQVDDAVGQVLACLDRLRLRENTIVIYSSDHGDFAGEHGMIEKAPGIGFHCITRIPMIWSWPGTLPTGAAPSHLFESVDFLPTVCALAGLPAPNWTDGQDATQLLLQDRKVRDFAVTENHWTKTIHSDRYKLTEFLPEFDGGRDFCELFDLREDPWELRNLANDPEYIPVRDGLRRELYRWLVRTTRPVTLNPGAPGASREVPGSISWDLRPELYGADGKLGPETARRLLSEGVRNYL